jgi:hypothetical protein
MSCPQTKSRPAKLLFCPSKTSRIKISIRKIAGRARLPTPPLFPPCYVGQAGAPQFRVRGTTAAARAAARLG